MEKIFSSLRAYNQEDGNRRNKFCATCGNLATREALFEVGGGVTLIEKYCEVCAKQVK